MSPLKSCGVLIVRGTPIREFLLMRHVDRWDLPKGHVDGGETPMQCALRELEEETGILAADISVDPDFRFTTQYKVSSKRTKFQPGQKEVIIFLAMLTRTIEIQCTEHESHQWFDWDPPHEIQSKTIDPLLSAVAEYWQVKL